MAAKRFSNINQNIFKSDPENAPSLNAMQSFPLCQIIEMGQDLGNTSSLPVHSLQQTVPVKAFSFTSRPSSSLKATMSVVAQHGSQIWDLERRIRLQDKLIHQLLSLHNPDNDSSSNTFLNSVASDNTATIKDFLQAGSL